MPAFARPIFCAALLAAALTLTTRAGAAADDSDSGIAIHQTGRVLVFPPDLLMEGVPSGEVQVVLSVDAKGQLQDCLVVGYTNPGFADEVTQVLKTWSYEPARVQGRAVASRVDLKIDFSSEVSVIVVNLNWDYWERVTGDWHRFVYRAYKLGELDRIPTPVHVVQPVLPKGDEPRGAPHRVSVEFFIDEEGRVRVPTVDRDEVNDVYAAAMVAAVEQWRFEPPRRHGRPVLVIARQDFTYRPKQ